MRGLRLIPCYRRQGLVPGGQGGGGGATLPPPSNFGTDIRNYISQSGDQIVTVPNGTYTAGAINNAARSATGGADNGWLILAAETQGGVTVDCTTELHLQGTTSRVAFIGFKFQNGAVWVESQYTRFWYCEFTFPVATWAAQVPQPAAPRTLYLAYGTVVAEVYGSDFHDTGTSVFVNNGARNVKLVGNHHWNINAANQYLNTVHPDAVGLVGGNVVGCDITDSYFEGGGNLYNSGIVPEDGNPNVHGPITGLNLTNLWITGFGAGINVDSAYSQYGVFGTMSNVWNWNNGFNLNEQVDGVDNTSTPNWRPDRINFTMSNYHETAPVGTDPATTWRAANPYSSWSDLSWP